MGLDILIWPYYYERTPREFQKNVEFFRIFLNFHDFFRFFRSFSYNFFCTVRYSHVLIIIRFAVKFHIGLSMSGHGGRLGKIVLYQKPSKNVILRGLKLRRLTSNQIYAKKHLKITGQLYIAMRQAFVRKHPRI